MASLEPIASDGRRTFSLRIVQPGEVVDAPFGGSAYPALVWNTGRTTAAQRDRLCESLIAGGCRYLLFGGREAAAWEDAADEASTSPDRAEGPDAHVMTASYAGYPPDEVAFDLVHTTDFANGLVLMVGDDVTVRAQLVASIREELAPAR
jgi:hypothetical protein